MNKRVIFFMLFSFLLICFLSINYVSFAKSNDLKINSDKDFVYDATYDTLGLVPSYPKEYGVFYLSDIKVPYINIDSNDAFNVNKEIESIYNDQLAEYERGINNSFVFVNNSNYEYYIDDNILSVYITYEVSGSLSITKYNYTYNFDLTTGDLINTFISNDLDKKIRDSIRNIVNNDEEFNTAIKYYEEDLNNNELKYYYNKDGLNVILRFSLLSTGVIEEKIINIK